MLVHFRKTIDELNHTELMVARSEINEYIEPDDFVSFSRRVGLYEPR